MGLGSSALLVPAAVLAQTGTAPGPGADESRRFRAYLEEDWKRWMTEYPEMATAVGFPGQNRRWTDDSPEGIERRKQHLRDSLAQLMTFSRETLPASERLNYDLYRELLESSQEGLKFGDDPLPFRQVVPRNLWMPINQMEGVQQAGASTIALMARQSLSDYEDILARLEALPKHVEQIQALLEAGLKRGYTPPRIALRDLPKQIADLVPTDPMASALLLPFQEVAPRRYTRATLRRPSANYATTLSSATSPPAAKPSPQARCRTAPRRTPSPFAGRPPRI
jgi:uncharacterized protein (DUF885 family)